MTLAIVSDYIADARTLLQDTVAPYRYPDADLVEALNMAWAEACRIRPDLLIDQKYQTRNVRSQPISGSEPLVVFSAAAETTAVPLPSQYKMPFLYFVVGQAQLRDTTDTQDARATALLNKFVAQLTNLMA